MYLFEDIAEYVDWTGTKSSIVIVRCYDCQLWSRDLWLACNWTGSYQGEESGTIFRRKFGPFGGGGCVLHTGPPLSGRWDYPPRDCYLEIKYPFHMDRHTTRRRVCIVHPSILRAPVDQGSSRTINHDCIHFDGMEHVETQRSSRTYIGTKYLYVNGTVYSTSMIRTTPDDRIENVGITLPLSLVKETDKARGDMPRSTFIRRAVDQYLKRKTK